MMRNAVIFFSLLFMISNVLITGQTAEVELKGTISISGAWALYPMAVKWAEEFQKIYPKVRIDIQAGGAGKGMADVLAGMVDIGSVSREIYSEEIEKGAFPIPVTKDAVVPTVNAQNPFLTEILKRGVKRETFGGIWITGEVKTWGEVIGREEEASIRVYTRSDACGAAKTWAVFFGKEQEDLLGVGVYGDPGLAEAVRRDRLGIGFNNINYAYDAKTKLPVAGIKVIPIDINGNSRIDEEENFYNTREELTDAINRGAYPSPPARDLYFVTKGKPEKKVLMEFLRWVLTEGQNYVPETGYIPLSKEKLESGLKKIGMKE
jgi:phosphate transport system substrate-binding protein